MRETIQLSLFSNNQERLSMSDSVAEILTISDETRQWGVQYARAMRYSAKTIDRYQSGKADTETVLQILEAQRRSITQQSFDAFNPVLDKLKIENKTLHESHDKATSDCTRILTAIKHMTEVVETSLFSPKKKIRQMFNDLLNAKKEE